MIIAVGGAAHFLSFSLGLLALLFWCLVRTFKALSMLQKHLALRMCKVYILHQYHLREMYYQTLLFNTLSTNMGD